MRATLPLALILLGFAAKAHSACPPDPCTGDSFGSSTSNPDAASQAGNGPEVVQVKKNELSDGTAISAAELVRLQALKAADEAKHGKQTTLDPALKRPVNDTVVTGKLSYEDLPQTRAPESLPVGAAVQTAADIADSAAQQASADQTPGMAPVWRTITTLTKSGDRDSATAAAQKALAEHPDDVQLQAFVRMTAPKQQTRVTEKTVAERAKQLMATLRGDAGEAPPGAGLTASPFGNPSGAQSPALASALAFPALGNAAAGGPRGMSPATLAELGHKDLGLKLVSPLVRDAVGRMMVRDLPAAEILLNTRLEQNPSDEPALRFRALNRRNMGKFEPSSHDAKSALELAPWDAKARRILIDDEIDLGHSDQALEEANAGMRETPNSADLYVARANVYGSLGDKAAQLADLKQAAMLDSQFEQLYQQALAGPAAPAQSKRPRSTAVWLGAIGTALLFFSFAVFRKRGDSSVRLAMRQDDHAVLQRAGRPDPAPAGFRIVKTLGQGGMGVVYEAVDLGLQRTVALKKLRAEIADSPRERARFLKEARTVAGLKHPNIVEIHAIHEDAEGLFLVFEKVQGQTLHERLGNGPLPPAEAVAVLRQVAKALDCAHSAGVVHQDLKPANIMVAGDVAKVMDFGIARRVQETLSTLSRVEIAGTPAYMAPEQEMGGNVGPAADIFALGACSYELLTGRTPFPHGGMMMKAEKMYRRASEVNPGISAAADNAIARALEPEPQARWPSATSFVEALARSLS